MTQPKIMIIPVTPFQQNCSLTWDDGTKRGFITDPGGDVERIFAAVKEQGVTVEKIFLTHGHLDHAGGAADLKAALKVPIEGPHRADAFLLDELGPSSERYGFATKPVTPDRWLADGDMAEAAGFRLEILHCPGHSPGSVVFFSRDHRFCLMGDVLFEGSIGRTDFPYGDHAALISAIKTKLFPLGDDVNFIPGHGGPSSIGRERLGNPFLV